VNATTAGEGQTGTLLMATNYNASEPPFEDKASMMQYHGGQSGRLTDDMVHGVECSPNKSVGDMHKYIRTDPVQDDIKSYDHGNLNFAVVNLPSELADKQIGELWVYYQVKLLKPKLGVARMVNQNVDRFDLQINDASTRTWSEALDFSRFGSLANHTVSTYNANNIDCHFDGRSLYFPASYTGDVELVCRGRMIIHHQQSDYPDIANMKLEFRVAGDITPTKSLILGSPQVDDNLSLRTGDLPAQIYDNYFELQQEPGVGSSVTVHFIGIVRVRVNSVTGDSDNKVTFYLASDDYSYAYGLNLSAVHLEVTEMKPTNADLALGKTSRKLV